MLNFDYITKEDIKKHNPKVLIVGGSGSAKKMHCLI